MTKNDIANALVQSQAIVPPLQSMGPMPAPTPQDMPIPPQASQNPFMLDTQLEQQAAPQRLPMHPLVAAVASRLGLLNMIRNQGNATMTAGDNAQ